MEFVKQHGETKTKPEWIAMQWSRAQDHEAGVNKTLQDCSSKELNLFQQALQSLRPGKEEGSEYTWWLELLLWLLSGQAEGSWRRGRSPPKDARGGSKRRWLSLPKAGLRGRPKPAERGAGRRPKSRGCQGPKRRSRGPERIRSCRLSLPKTCTRSPEGGRLLGAKG